ncbi:6,7-dimethyl-8-ribityllumazine synthase [Azospirillum thermophilum]|uniref:6,7-dimethyl-8-ribityllumazine synthase n=1 Tax=Azospirillum thermophilum TaxID=2202148 RepID=A0A2S2CR62_9PROT|nr:6,7-dimethyl-8-ribityllumazine synthase [Azospirillum thermophilum]AWK86860.1 6,7-dimethyl-8-ribityllumazine synthase [Azospirillum thermophilum]
MSDTPHIMVVEARFHEDIVEELARGAVAELERNGATCLRVPVPGCLEIPAAIAFAVRSMDFFTARKRFDGYVALGCVIRGETTQYDMVCTESARGLQTLAMRYALAIGNGILTVENREQAWGRAATGGRNKGGFAARACLDMIELKRQFRLYPR